MASHIHMESTRVPSKSNKTAEMPSKICVRSFSLIFRSRALSSSSFNARYSPGFKAGSNTSGPMVIRFKYTTLQPKTSNILFTWWNFPSWIRSETAVSPSFIPAGGSNMTSSAGSVFTPSSIIRPSCICFLASFGSVPSM